MLKLLKEKYLSLLEKTFSSYLDSKTYYYLDNVSSICNLNQNDYLDNNFIKFLITMMVCFKTKKDFSFELENQKILKIFLSFFDDRYQRYSIAKIKVFPKEKKIEETKFLEIKEIEFSDFLLNDNLKEKIFILLVFYFFLKMNFNEQFTIEKDRIKITKGNKEIIIEFNHIINFFKDIEIDNLETFQSYFFFIINSFKEQESASKESFFFGNFLDSGKKIIQNGANTIIKIITPKKTTPPKTTPPETNSKKLEEIKRKMIFLDERETTNSETEINETLEEKIPNNNKKYLFLFFVILILFCVFLYIYLYFLFLLPYIFFCLVSLLFVFYFKENLFLIKDKFFEYLKKLLNFRMFKENC